MAKFAITEKAEQKFIEDCLNEAFCPTTDKVLHIKDYLDKNFAKQGLDDIDDNGYPVKRPTVVMLSTDKQPIKTLDMKEFLLLLDDKFHGMISDEGDRRKFLKQVITDWWNDSITKTGLLSVNYL